MVTKAATGIRNRGRRSYHFHMHKLGHHDLSLKFLESSIPWHLAFAFLISVLVGVLQVHCQGSNSSPFMTHLPNMLAFLLALLVYCFALVYYVKSQLCPIGTATCSKFSAQVALIAGLLASASALSVLLPRCFQAVTFIICFFLSAFVVRNLIVQMGQWLYSSFKNVVSYIYRKWKRITGSNNDGAAL